MAKKNLGYSINYSNSTVTLTRKFYEEAREYNSEAYLILQGLKLDLPSLRIITPPARKSGSKAKVNYEAMTAYINCIPFHAQKYLAMFEEVKRLAKSQKNQAGFVKKWFFRCSLTLAKCRNSIKAVLSSSEPTKKQGRKWQRK